MIEGPLAPLRAALRRGADEPQWEDSRLALADTRLFASRGGADSDEEDGDETAANTTAKGVPYQPLLLRHFQGPLAPAAAAVRSAAASLAGQAVATASRLRHVAAQQRTARRAAHLLPVSPPPPPPFRPAGVSRCGAAVSKDGKRCGCSICRHLGPFTPPPSANDAPAADSDAWAGTPFKAALLTSLARQLRLSLAFQIWAARTKVRHVRAAAVDDATTLDRRAVCRAAFQALHAQVRLAAAAERAARLFASPEARVARGCHRQLFLAWRRRADVSHKAAAFLAAQRLRAAMAHWRLFVLTRRRQQRLLTAARTLSVVGHYLPRAFYAWRAQAARNALLGRRILDASARGVSPGVVVTHSAAEAKPRGRIARSRAAAMHQARGEACPPEGTLEVAAALVRLRRFWLPRGEELPVAGRLPPSAAPAPVLASLPRRMHLEDGASMSLLATADAAAAAAVVAMQHQAEAVAKAARLADADAVAADAARKAHFAWREAERRVGATAVAAAASEQEARNSALAQGPRQQVPRGRVVPSAEETRVAAHSARVAAAEAVAIAQALQSAMEATSAEHRAAAALSAQAAAAAEAARNQASEAAALAKATAVAAAGAAAERLHNAQHDVATAKSQGARAEAACSAADMAVADARMRLCASEAAFRRAAECAGEAHVALKRGASARAAIEQTLRAARQLAHASTVDATVARQRVVKGPGAKQALVEEADALTRRARAAAHAGVQAAMQAAQRVVQLEVEAREADGTTEAAKEGLQRCRLHLTHCLAAQAAAHTAKRESLTSLGRAQQRVEALTSAQMCPVPAQPPPCQPPHRSGPAAPRPPVAAVAWAMRRRMRVAFAAWRHMADESQSAALAVATRALLACAVRCLRKWHHLAVARQRTAHKKLLPWRASLCLHAWAAEARRAREVRAAVAATQSIRRLGVLRLVWREWRGYARQRMLARVADAGAMAAAGQFAAAAAVVRTRPRVLHAWRALAAERRRITAGSARLLELRLKGMLRAWRRFAVAAGLLRRVLAVPLQEHAAGLAADAHACSAARASEVLQAWRRLAQEGAAHRSEAAGDTAATLLRRSWLLSRAFSAMQLAAHEPKLLRACLHAWGALPRAKGSRRRITAALVGAGFQSVTHVAARLRLRCALASWRRHVVATAAVAAAARRRRLMRCALSALHANVVRNSLEREQQHVARRQVVRWRRDVLLEAWRDVAASARWTRAAVADMRVAHTRRLLRAWRDVARESGSQARLEVMHTRAAAAAVLAALQARAAEERGARLLVREASVVGPGAAAESHSAGSSQPRPWLPPPARGVGIQRVR